MTGKMVRKEKYFWGFILGIAYYVLFLAVSFLAKGRWDMTLAHAVTTFLCVWEAELWEVCCRKKNTFKIRSFVIYYAKIRNDTISYEK